MVFGAYTGDGYASGWNTSGIGGFSVRHLKHLYLALSLGRHVEVKYEPVSDSRKIDGDGRIRQRWIPGGPAREAHQIDPLFDEITGTYGLFAPRTVRS